MDRRFRLQNIVGLSVGEALPEGKGISNGTFGGILARWAQKNSYKKGVMGAPINGRK